MKRRQKDKAGSKRKARPAKRPKPGLPYTVMKDAPPYYAPEVK